MESRESRGSNEKLLQRIHDLERQLTDYQVLIDNTPDLLYRTDREGKITYVSQSVERLSGYTVAEAIGMKMAEEVYLHPEQRQEFLETIVKEGFVHNFEAQLLKKDGTVWWASTNAYLRKDEEGNITGVEGVTRNVDELKQAEEALKASEELFRLAFYTSPDSINLNRVSDGLYIDINEGFTNIMGYTREEAIGKTALSLNIWKNPEDRERLVEELGRKGYVNNLEAEFVTKKGEIKIGLMSARVLQLKGEAVFLSVTRDVTEKKQLELQLQQAQKFEALGTLAGGIAHDFNNLLMGIQGRASLIGFQCGDNRSLGEHVQGIEQCVQSAKNLTSQILGFTRGGKYEISAIDVHGLLEKTGSMFGRTNKGIDLGYRLCQEQVVVEGDWSQLEQVFINLFVNAQQAMPHGGRLLIETNTVNLGELFCLPNGLVPGRFCKISITDSGTGMDYHTRQRAFDPFFTTKEKGRGTGLGLASALGIIKNHAGVITLYSEVNMGTTVNVYLPVSSSMIDAAHPLDEEVYQGSETVLLVDDEQMVIDVGRAMLEQLGYKVITASSGVRAIEVMKEGGAGIDIVILDLIMPGMDGEKTFAKLRGINPKIPILLSSGYSVNGKASELLQKGGDGFIQKPFSLSELSVKLRTILEAKKTH